MKVEVAPVELVGDDLGLGGRGREGGGGGSGLAMRGEASLERGGRLTIKGKQDAPTINDRSISKTLCASPERARGRGGRRFSQVETKWERDPSRGMEPT